MTELFLGADTSVTKHVVTKKAAPAPTRDRDWVLAGDRPSGRRQTAAERSGENDSFSGRRLNGALFSNYHAETEFFREFVEFVADKSFNASSAGDSQRSA